MGTNEHHRNPLQQVPTFRHLGKGVAPVKWPLVILLLQIHPQKYPKIINMYAYINIIKLYYITSYYIILYSIILYYIILYYIWYYIILYYIKLSYMILYYVMLYCIVLYHIILYLKKMMLYYIE